MDDDDAKEIDVDHGADGDVDYDIVTCHRTW